MTVESQELFPMTDARMLPVDKVQPGAYQPRKHFDEQAMAQMTASVKKHGVMQPILVRLVPGSKDRWEIVAGERRWRASRSAFRDEIPAIVRDLTTMEVLELQAIENIQREDLHPLEEAHSYDLLLHPPEDLPGKTVEEIAEIVSKSTAHVRRQLALCNLIPDGATAFLADQINVSTARLIARMPVGIQAQALPKILATRADETKPVAHADAERVMQQAFMLRLSSAPFPIKDASLVEGAGGCNVCPKRTGANPDLFNDVQDADTCTDPECHATKVVAHNERRKAAAAADGIQVIDGKAAAALLKFGPDSSQLNADYVYMDEPLEELTGSKSSLHKLLGTNLKPSALYEHPRDKSLREIVHTHKAREVLKEHELLVHKPSKGDASWVEAASTSTATARPSKANQAAADKKARAEAERRKKEAEATDARIKQENTWRTAVFRAIHHDLHDRGGCAPEVLLVEALVDYASGYLTHDSWILLAELWGWVEGQDWDRDQQPDVRLRECIRGMNVEQLTFLMAEVVLLSELDVQAFQLDDEPEETLLARACDDPDSELDVAWRDIRAESLPPAGNQKGKAKKVAKATTEQSPPTPTNSPTPAGEGESAPTEGDAGKPASPEDTIQAPSAQTRNEGSDLPHWVGQMVKVKKAKRVGKVVEICGDGTLEVAVESWRTKQENVSSYMPNELDVLPGQQRPGDEEHTDA